LSKTKEVTDSQNKTTDFWLIPQDQYEMLFLGKAGCSLGQFLPV